MMHRRGTILIKSDALVSGVQTSLGIWGGEVSWVSDVGGGRCASSGLALNSAALPGKWEVAGQAALRYSLLRGLTMGLVLLAMLKCPESLVQTGVLPPPTQSICCSQVPISFPAEKEDVCALLTDV